MSLNEVIAILTASVWFYVVLGVIAFLFVFSFFRGSVRKGLQSNLQDLEYRYSLAKTIPLLHKLNKAVALSRINQDVATKIEPCQTLYDETQIAIRNVQELLSDSDEFLVTGKFALARKNNRDVEDLLQKLEKSVSELNNILDSVLQQEAEQRDQINVLKDEFRALKKNFNENSEQFVYSYEAIERKLSEIEKLFSSFEEWVFASEFEKANNLRNEIRQNIYDLKEVYDNLPKLLVMARGILPRTVDEVSSSYAQAKQKGVYLKHLEIAKNIEFISESMKSDLHSLKSANTKQIDEHLNDCQTRLNQLLQQIGKEVSSSDEVTRLKSLVFNDIANMQKAVANIKDGFEKTSERFGFTNIEETIAEMESAHASFDAQRKSIEKKLKTNNTSATERLIELRELRQTLDIKLSDLKVIQEKLDHACQDENHAKSQLLKLHLIINEMRSKVRKNRLASISENYEEDLKKAYNYVDSIKQLLDEEPLNINQLNATLKDSIDFIYRLYNDVNKILGSASMVEEVIMIGNRCRSTYPEVDSDLSLAELSYQNGEYTKALSVSIKSLEKIYPNSDDLIRANSRRG